MAKKTLSYREIAYFCQELSLLIHAGVSVGDGLALLAEEEKDGFWRERFSRMARLSDEGMSLAQIVKEVDCFPNYMTGFINVGELSGRLEEALNSLMAYYEERDRMNRRVKSALLYPSILLLLMLIVMVILLTQVLPVFRSVYASLGGEMTGVAGVLLNIGLWLNDCMPILFAIMGVIVAAVIVFAASQSVREKVLHFWRSRMGDKGLMRVMNDASLAQAIAMGVSSGLPMDETMEMATQVLVDVPAAQKRCEKCRELLLDGESTVDALRAAEIFPPATCRLLTLGMQSGTADVTIKEIARRLSDDADIALSNKIAKVEPTLVLITSILVGAVLLSVMLPLINIMEAIG